MALTKPVSEALNMTSLASGSTSAIGSCSQMDMSQASHFGLTARAQFDSSAVAGITVHLRSSPGSVTTTYDTQDIGAAEGSSFSLPSSFVAGSHAGTTLQKSVLIEADLKYYKVVVENNDSTHAVSNVTVDEIKQKVAPYTG